MSPVPLTLRISILICLCLTMGCSKNPTSVIVQNNATNNFGANNYLVLFKSGAASIDANGKVIIQGDYTSSEEAVVVHLSGLPSGAKSAAAELKDGDMIWIRGEYIDGVRFGHGYSGGLTMLISVPKNSETTINVDASGNITQSIRMGNH